MALHCHDNPENSSLDMEFSHQDQPVLPLPRAFKRSEYDQESMLLNISDDMVIAEGLLKEPKVPQRSTSLACIPTTLRGLAPAMNPNSRNSTDASRVPGLQQAIRSSNTWTSSSGDALPDHDDTENRQIVREEYNKLARRHNIRTLGQDDEDSDDDDNSVISSAKLGMWLKKMLRKTSSSQVPNIKRNNSQLKHRRSISDLSIRLKLKKDTLKDKTVQDLIRLCGSSLLYLPPEYAPGGLVIPTCIRAATQYLVQHATTTRGVFRTSGSQNVINGLYEYYCPQDEFTNEVSGTVHAPSLPEHIKYGVHDVASVFKKFLSCMPGGILGSTSLFDIFVSIQTQLNKGPDLTRTKHTKVRARLIALAIYSLKSQYRRELICAVFGLLCMIGRAAETAPREDERGRPLPTHDLMGYRSLSIIFGPLLIGNQLENYSMRRTDPNNGVVLLPVSPPKPNSSKARKSKHSRAKSIADDKELTTNVNKVNLANSIVEMIITHWRDSVRHMKDLKLSQRFSDSSPLHSQALRPSISNSFVIHKPFDWENDRRSLRLVDSGPSPTPAQEVHRSFPHRLRNSPKTQMDDIVVGKRQEGNRKLSTSRSLGFLSSTTKDQRLVREHQTCFERKDSDDFGSISVLRNGISNAAQNLTNFSNSPKSMLQERCDKDERFGSIQKSENTYRRISSTNRLSVCDLESAHSSASARFPIGTISGLSHQMKLSGRSSCLSMTTDPLSRISHEEDLASLATLAQVMGSMDESVDDLSISEEEAVYENFIESEQPQEIKGSMLNDTGSQVPTEAIGMSQGSNLIISSLQPDPFNSSAPQHLKHGSSHLKTSRASPPRASVKELAARFNSADLACPYMPSPVRSKTTPVSLGLSKHRVGSNESMISPYKRNSMASNLLISCQASPKVLPKLDFPVHAIKFELYDSSSPRNIPLPASKPSTPFRVHHKAVDGSELNVSHSARRSADIPRDHSKKSRSVVFGDSATKSKSISDSVNNFSCDPKRNRPDLSPVARHIHFMQSNASGLPISGLKNSPLDEMNLLHNPGNSPPKRENSVLYSRMKTLERNLAIKDEEIQQLKQNVNTREELDVETFRSQLEVAKKNAEVWKTRALVAEKQLRAVKRASEMTRGRQDTEGDVFAGQGFVNEKTFSDIRTRKAMRGMDGAASSSQGASDDSNRTIIRGGKGRLTRLERH